MFILGMKMVLHYQMVSKGSLYIYIYIHIDKYNTKIYFSYKWSFLYTDNGIAFGVTIGALTTQSCDASWIPSSTSWNLTDASFKLMELDSLSVYWNHVKKDQLFGGLNLGDLAVRDIELSACNNTTC